MAGLGNYLLMIGRRQQRPQQRERRQRDCTLSQQIEYDRELARDACRFNPAISGVLRQPQHLRAVREERRTPFAKIQAARIELGQERHESRGCPALARGRIFDLFDERQIGKVVRDVRWVSHSSL